MLNFNVRTDILSAVCRPVYGCWSARLFWRCIYKLQLLSVTPRVYRTLMVYHVYLATGNVIHIPRVYCTRMVYHVYLATGNVIHIPPGVLHPHGLPRLSSHRYCHSHTPGVLHPHGLPRLSSHRYCHSHTPGVLHPHGLPPLSSHR